jgi:ABC-type multidrug transport system permease subunit
MHTTDQCLNCDTVLDAKQNFCSHCGQTAHTHRLSMPHLAHEAVHYFTHADKGIFHLLRQLALRPGIVAKEYVRGKRKKYFSPLNFFFIVVGLFLFVQITFKPMQGVNMAAMKEAVNKIPDPSIRERRLAKLERAESATNFMARYSNYVNMAVTPFVALLFFLFFIKSGYNYTEHLVANLYIAGFNALFFICIITPFLLLAKGTAYYLLGIYLFLAWEAFYRAYTYYRFLPGKGFRHGLAVSLVALLTVVVWTLLSRGLIGWYIETGFN